MILLYDYQMTAINFYEGIHKYIIHTLSKIDCNFTHNVLAAFLLKTLCVKMQLQCMQNN